MSIHPVCECCEHPDAVAEKFTTTLGGDEKTIWLCPLCENMLRDYLLDGPRNQSPFRLYINPSTRAIGKVANEILSRFEKITRSVPPWVGCLDKNEDPFKVEVTSKQWTDIWNQMPDGSKMIDYTIPGYSFYLYDRSGRRINFIVGPFE